VLSAALVVPGARAFRLPVPPGASATFHGRDLFAPAAAALAIGTPIGQIGMPHATPVVRKTPAPREAEGGVVEGEVVTVDRFGNLITNIPGPAEGAWLMVGGRRLTVCRTYADAGPGCVLALTGSSGRIEIAVREGNAAEMLGVGRGTIVRMGRSA
jgi:S-adenosylmethionine hydrolase